MKRIKWFLVPACACFILVPLAGCWSTYELTDQTFARVMILDKAKEGIELTLGFPLSNKMVSSQVGGEGGGGEEQSGPPYTFVTKTDRQVTKAYRDIQSDLSRRISFGQLSIIVIGRKLAEHGIRPVVDFIAREPKLHINTYLFVAEGNGSQLANVPLGFEKYPEDILSGFADKRTTANVTLKDLLMANHTGGDLVIPMIVFGRQGMVKKTAGEVWMGTDGAAVFRQGKMVRRLNTNEMRGALWILGKLQDAEVNVPSPTDGKNVSFLVWHEKTRIVPVINDRLSIRIQCKAQVDVLASESNIDLNDPEKLRQLERSLGDKMAKRMASAIAATKAAKSDAFQLGNYIRWRYPGRWKEIRANWRELYVSQTDITEQVDVTIKRLGVVHKVEGERLRTSKGESR